MFFDPVKAKTIVHDCVSAFELTHEESPARIRVGSELYRALVKPPHFGRVEVGGVPVSLDTRLGELEIAADLTLGLAT